jgi:hypothetical protein
LGIKEMLNSTLVLCTLYRCLDDWIPPKEEASQKETLVITVKCMSHEVKKVVSGEILSHSQEEYMYIEH